MKNISKHISQFLAYNLNQLYRYSIYLDIFELTSLKKKKLEKKLKELKCNL